MMVERVNIKMPPEVRDRFNEKRGDQKQAVFLNELLDLYEEQEQSSDCLTADEARGIVREIVREEVNEAISNARR